MMMVMLLNVSFGLVCKGDDSFYSQFNCDDFEDENLGEFVKVQIFLLLIKAASYVVSDLNLLFIWISNLFL